MYNNCDHDYLLKIVCIGNADSGKSTLVLSAIQGKFTSYDDYWGGEPIGVDFFIKTIKVDNNIVKMQIWDTAGRERFGAITSSYYRGANIILLMYSVQDYKSYEDISKFWYQQVKDSCSNNSSAIMILVANKCDSCHREVSFEQGCQLADTLGMKFFKVSALTYNNVNTLFEYCAENCVQQAIQQSRIQLCMEHQTPTPSGNKSINIITNTQKDNNGINLFSCC